MPPSAHLDRSAALLLVFLCGIWGFQQTAIKIASAGVSPMLQAGMRSAGAGLLVWLWATMRGVPLWARDGSARAGIAAGLLFAGEFALLFWSLRYTTASRGIIFLYTAPFFVALGAVWLLPAERLRRAQWIGLLLAFGGVVALFGEHLVHGGGQAWKGDLMMLGAAVFWAATTLLIKASRLATCTPEKTLLYQLAVSGLALPALSLASGERGVTRMDGMIAGSLAFQIMIVASASYLAWFWLIRRYSATRLSSFAFLTPVFGVLAGAALLDEPLTPAVAAALVLVGLGIWLANRPAPAAAGAQA